ncbi:C39 family peptidase [bacterium]|nr:C39 family peptidase [bacterium]
MQEELPFQIQAQPNETTCGATCLHAVYRYFGDDIPLNNLVEEVPQLEGGGTLAAFLGCHALKRGYRARIYTYNLKAFDPTWFSKDDVDLRERLKAQLEFKHSRKLRVVTRGYREFLKLGGKIHFEDLRTSLIRRFLKKGIPIITGLSATYLYRIPREFGPKADSDDLRGEPSGHFVVLCGYDSATHEVVVADPLRPNPPFQRHVYRIEIERVICAILLGILTDDANLLVLEAPPGERKSAPQ